MNHDDWHKLWEAGDTGWHSEEPNSYLVEYIEALGLNQGDRVFIPLCGKTVDIPWLVSQGFHVVGIELSEIAIQQVFDSLSLTPVVTTLGALKKYSADQIDLFVGDFFALDANTLGPVQAVFDRGALVALPAPLRIQYAIRLQAITEHAKILLVCFEYDQSLLEGPPFAITPDEIKQHYGQSYEIEQLVSIDAKSLLGVDFPLNETIWMLIP
ncbi:MAG: thiopurine S-methyltransferase [Cellvibrionales bacterium]|nr:thiopurine S-methyltransferase [Cellvibrionales bacterium]